MMFVLGFLAGGTVGIVLGAMLAAGAREDDRRARASFTPHPARRITYDDDEN